MAYILTLDELVVVHGLGGEFDFEVARVRGSRKGLVLCETLAGLTIHASPDCILDGGEEEEVEEEVGEQGREGGGEMEMEGFEEEANVDMDDDGEHDDFVALMQHQHQLQNLSNNKAAGGSSSGSSGSSRLLAEHTASRTTVAQLDASFPNPRDCISYLLRIIAVCEAYSPDYVLSLSLLQEYLCQKKSLAPR